MMGTKRWFVTLIALAAILMWAGMSAAANPPGFDDNEIRIGQWGPQTGPAAPWGSVARGSKLLFDIVNEEGGINGRKIKYFIRDDMYNPAQTSAVVKELVERQGVFAFVGGVGRQDDFLAIPRDAGRQPAAGAGGGSVFIELALDAPVVGDVEFPPSGGIETGRLRAGRIALEERPVLVE